MSLQSLARSAFAAIKIVAADALVPIIYKGKTASGLRDTSTQGDSITTDGAMGETSGIVRVDASEIDMPEKSDTIIVDGKTVFIGDVKRDSVGAILTIYFTETRPYGGA